MAAMTSFQADKCYRLVNTHIASVACLAYGEAPTSSWSIVHSYLFKTCGGVSFSKRADVDAVGRQSEVWRQLLQQRMDQSRHSVVRRSGTTDFSERNAFFRCHHVLQAQAQTKPRKQVPKFSS